jgi:LysR family transcriptional regulator, regulator of abg operon
VAIDPRALRTFLAVCREGSISGAARRLNVTQPAVSATINQLEYSVGEPLFSRARSGITLTPAGIVLRRSAEAIDALLSRAEREVALAKRNVSGPLVVGGTPGALLSLVPRAVSIVRQKYPAFELLIRERPDDQLSDLLRSGRIDIAIVTTGIVPQRDDLIEESILSDPFSLMVGAANFHLPERVQLRSLGDAAWVLPDAAGAFRRQVDALFVATEAPTPGNVIRCDSLLTTKALVAEGDYVTILPREVAAAEIAVGSIREIAIEGAFLRNVGVRMRADAAHSPFVADFLEALRASRPVFREPDPVAAASLRN